MTGQKEKPRLTKSSFCPESEPRRSTGDLQGGLKCSVLATAPETASLTSNICGQNTDYKGVCEANLWAFCMRQLAELLGNPGRVTFSI
jgi:hypothetical protein